MLNTIGVHSATMWLNTNAGLRLLRERGVETALLGTSSENEKMHRAAEAVGFRVESTRVWFVRSV